MLGDNKKYCLDANFFITIYTVHYLRTVFPGLYTELGQKIPATSVVLKEIHDEIKVNPDATGKIHTQMIIDLKSWIEQSNIEREKLDTNDTVFTTHRKLINHYQPNEEDPKSISENDLLIIACAKEYKLTVVTYESVKTNNRPGKIERSKIPLICEQNEVNCITAIEYFQELGIVLE